MNDVVLVDKQDNIIGSEEKLKAHLHGGRLHRAFSIFVFNNNKALLLQRRALSKYHSGGLWTNTCCSHPTAGEDLDSAVHRRLKEEMGFDCDLKEIFSFIYKADVGGGLTEWEFDHVFFGVYDNNPVLNHEEADDFKWVSLNELKLDIKLNPEKYTAWFKVIFKDSLKQLESELV